MRGLLGNTGKECAFFLGLNDADRFAINKEEIVAGAGLKWRLAQRNTLPGAEIHRLVILNDPTAGNELCVDLPPRELFGC